MTIQSTVHDLAAELEDAVHGPVLTDQSEGYAAEVAAFNLAVQQRPLVAVGALDSADVASAIRIARRHGARVAIQTTGHGAMHPITAEILISTRRMDEVSVDAGAKVARIGGGSRWGSVVALAAAHGLLPIAGSSANVGVVGYLMGGGLGPLARTYGFSSDYIVGATVVSGAGEVLEVSATENPDLFWAIRGGKYELGVVTEIRVRLVELASLYGGFLLFGTDDIDRVLRGWSSWTTTAPDEVSTSLALMSFPDMEQVPPFLRGRRVAMLRFGYPGAASEGEALAAPLRALAEAEMDTIGTLAAGDIAQIHNDPTDPGPSWLRGVFLTAFPDDAASILLETVGEGSPFTIAELRHYGGSLMQETDTEDSSAVGGREVHMSIGFGGFNPGRFAELPAASDRMLDRLEQWIAPFTNINFRGDQVGARHPLSAWPDATNERIADVRRKYDPDGVFH